MSTAIVALKREVSQPPVRRARTTYFVVVSLLYVVAGTIIIVRSIAASVLPLIVLGIVLAALGVVRLRDFRRRNNL